MTPNARPTPADTGHAAPRVSEVLGALASAADLANGWVSGKVLRTALLAARMAELAGCGVSISAQAYYLSQLRYLGCTGFAHEEANLYGAGDDIALRRTMGFVDGRDKPGALRAMFSGFAPDANFLSRTAGIARLVAGGDTVQRHAHAQCNSALGLARIAGLEAPLVDALAAICERWDGRGEPHHLAGESIPLVARLHNFADVVEIAWHRGGLELARTVVGARRGGQFDPALSDLFLRHARELDQVLSTTTLWEDFLAAEPGPPQRLLTGQLDDLARALGYFADLKSTWLLGHSQRVAQLAATASQALAFTPEDTARVTRAAHLHDLGRVAVPTGLWDKPGRLGALEWHQVRQHTQHTELILSLSPALADLCPIACAAHEEPRGRGYHRRLDAHTLSPLADLLSACDAISAMGEDRPHRPAMARDVLIKTIRDETRDGRHDARSVDAALEVMGLAAPRPADRHALSEREREVLVWVARGKTNKEIGTILGISGKTVQHHVAHLYEKIGINSRAGAAIYAMEHHLLHDE